MLIPNKDNYWYFNQTGAAIDKKLKAEDKLKALFPEQENLALVALQWILQLKEVSCIIPGASSVDHVKSNLSVFDSPGLSQDKFLSMNDIYKKYIKADSIYRQTCYLLLTKKLSFFCYYSSFLKKLILHLFYQNNLGVPSFKAEIIPFKPAQGNACEGKTCFVVCSPFTLALHRFLINI